MRRRKLLTLSLVLSMLMTGCGSATPADNQTTDAVKEEATAPESVPEVSEQQASDEESVDEAADQEVSTSTGPKQVVVYFANWNLGADNVNGNGEVAGIAWDKVSYINHAFWAVAPADGSTATSFEQRVSGDGARTQFKIVSTNPKNDYEDTAASKSDSSIARNHFAEYEAFSAKYPDVNIMISIGGWSACGYFSEMAYTKEGRTSFIDSCLELMDQYSWIDGIDIDWEYPGGSKDGERNPEGDGDQGCPIFGTAAEDSVNFTALLTELRAAMDEHYGAGAKKLTACASSSTGWTLPMQDWASFAPFLDMINIMTYDMAGLWDGATGHASSFWGSKAAASYFMGLDIPREKLCIGSPLYATTFLMTDVPSNALGAAIENYKPTYTELGENTLRGFEQEAVSGFTYIEENGKWSMGEEFDNGGTGWHMGYDTKKGGAYLYNDDESSTYYKWFISYENPLSLQEKLDYINEKNLAGIIVWENSQDTSSNDFITQMSDNLR
ncbi:MAG: hypothetical protein K6G30_00695 [Acetatifactor sp.]|nr:hypothetical protein [Acetatifactor sp.]